jgi:hypothetical protein
MKIFLKTIYLFPVIYLPLLLLTSEIIPAQEANNLISDQLRNDTIVIPAEPVAYDKEEVDSFLDMRNGLYFRLFDLNESGKVNYMTARRTNGSSVNEFWNTVVYTFQYPLFYWIDLNKNGRFESDQNEMWIDREEDGLNGNEAIY